MLETERYIELADRYRPAKLRAVDSFSRYQLEMLERSYRTLSESAAVLERSCKVERGYA